MSTTSMSQAAVASAQEMAKAFIPIDAAPLKPTVAQAVDVYDVSSYAKRSTALIEAEEANNNQVRQTLEKMRAETSKAAQTAATARNMAYVQSTKAAYSDNIKLNSAVPVVVEQTPETVVNDDALMATQPMTIKEAYIAVEQANLNAEDAERAYAALEQGDPTVAAQMIHDQNELAQAEARYLAQLDCTKQVATELAKESSEQFARNLMADLADGTITPNDLTKNVDTLLASVGTSIGSYLGAALAGVPNPNNCASQTLTNIALGTSTALTVINGAANTFNGLATFGMNLADSINDVYRHGPELLVNLAESTAQTAAQTALLALRNAARTNCTMALVKDTITGAITVGHTAIKAGISVATTAKDLKGSVDKVINVVKKKDFVGDLKKKVKMHPAVRELDRFIKADKTDLAAYSRLTRTGTKFARVTLGSNRQKQLSSAMYHSAQTVQTSRNWINRGKYSTTPEANKYNLFARSPYSLLEI